MSATLGLFLIRHIVKHQLSGSLDINTPPRNRVYNPVPGSGSQGGKCR